MPTGRSISKAASISAAPTNQQAEPFAPESRELLSLAAYIALQSRGQPIAPPDDPRLAPFREQGAEIYRRRQGQLNLSCAICHDDNAGKKLAGVDHPAGASDRLSDLSPRMAGAGLAEAPAAQLPGRHSRRSLCLRRSRICGARDLSDGPRPGHAPRCAGRAALTEGKYSPAPAPGRWICCANGHIRLPVPLPLRSAGP